jgi:hypothetical protein
LLDDAESQPNKPPGGDLLRDVYPEGRTHLETPSKLAWLPA